MSVILSFNSYHTHISYSSLPFAHSVCDLMSKTLYIVHSMDAIRGKVLAFSSMFRNFAGWNRCCILYTPNILKHLANLNYREQRLNKKKTLGFAIHEREKNICDNRSVFDKKYFIFYIKGKWRTYNNEPYKKIIRKLF